MSCRCVHHIGNRALTDTIINCLLLRFANAFNNVLSIELLIGHRAKFFNNV